MTYYNVTSNTFIFTNHIGTSKIDHLFASSSIESAAQSMSEAARARPTTKLLESGDLPKLDAPTRPYVRLKAPRKLQSQEIELEKNNREVRVGGF